MIRCDLCKCSIDKEKAPFPVISHENGTFKRIWYCSQSCMGIVWPDAAPPVQPGDMFTSEYIAFTDPRRVVELGEYEHLTATEKQGGGFQCLSIDEEKLPYDQWAVLYAHPDDPNTFFLVPWTGDEEMSQNAKIHDQDENAPSALYLPCEAKAIYTAWQHKDRPESKKPRQVFLFLGRGIWRNFNDLDLSSRQQRLTDDSIRKAKSALKVKS